MCNQGREADFIIRKCRFANRIYVIFGISYELRPWPTTAGEKVRSKITGSKQNDKLI